MVGIVRAVASLRVRHRIVFDCAEKLNQKSILIFKINCYVNWTICITSFLGP
jgi:hypothetical protein